MKLIIVIFEKKIERERKREAFCCQLKKNIEEKKKFYINSKFINGNTL